MEAIRKRTPFFALLATALTVAPVAAGAPPDVFFEIVPVFDLVSGTDLGLNGAVGARYWFR